MVQMPVVCETLQRFPLHMHREWLCNKPCLDSLWAMRQYPRTNAHVRGRATYTHFVTACYSDRLLECI